MRDWLRTPSSGRAACWSSSTCPGIRNACDFHENPRAVITASRWQVRQKINTGSVARWRNYEKHLGPLLSLAEPGTLAR